MSVERHLSPLRDLLASDRRILVVVAGPNGAGKTTFVETFLKATGILVVNPDQVARALSSDAAGADAYEAARVADAWRRDLVARGASFCIETVFSDPHGAKLGFLRQAQSQGYALLLIFIGLDSVDLAIGRVVERTRAGGHDVPDEKIAPRFPRTLANLREALGFVDHALLFDNSSATAPYRFLAAFQSGRLIARSDFRPAWSAVLLD